MIAKTVPDTFSPFCANFNHAFPPETMIADYLWFQDKLKGEFTFPKMPKSELLLDQEDSIPIFKVTPAKTQLQFKRVEMFFTDGRNPLTRFWITGEPKANKDGTWQIKCPVLHDDEPLFAFANVIYAIDPIHAPHHRYHGLTEMAATSDYAYAWPDQLKASGVTPRKVQNRLIDDFSAGLRDWSGLEWQFGQSRLVEYRYEKNQQREIHGSPGRGIGV